ncbi:MAG: aldo/keto reductase [Promethearchaeota archaeon]|jgi:aryl-alcohol dehydrogenase-like predicted oxidoreductase
MKYRILGRTGLRVSELGFGGHEYKRPLPTTLGRWGDIDLQEFMKKQPRRNELIEKAIELGINYYDATQPEEAKSLGIALKEAGAREDVYVALMILRPLNKIAGKPRSDWERIITEDVEEKLDLLQSSYADLLYLHQPEAGYSIERFTETIEVLRKLKEEGSIRWIATSSHKPRFLGELIRAYDCFDSVMIRYNYHLQEARDVIFPLCKAQEIGVVVMKPISWPYYGIPFTCFGPIEEKGPLSPIQNSLRWILNSEQVSTVVPGMNNRKELEENVKAIEIDEKIDEKILNRYLEMAQEPRSKEKLEKMLSDPSVDIRHFSKRALKFSK